MVFIILDLDETLIHTFDVTNSYSRKLANQADFYFKIKNPNNNDDNYYWIKKRPGLNLFLEFLFKYFTVGIWTAAAEDYAKEICKRLLNMNQLRKIKFIYSRNFCYLDTSGQQAVFTKPLIKIFQRYPSMQANNTLIIDNSPHTFKHNIQNGIQIGDYIGDPKDRSLYKIRNLIIKYYQRAPKYSPVWPLIYHLNMNL